MAATEIPASDVDPNGKNKHDAMQLLDQLRAQVENGTIAGIAFVVIESDGRNKSGWIGAQPFDMRIMITAVEFCKQAMMIATMDMLRAAAAQPVQGHG